MYKNRILLGLSLILVTFACCSQKVPISFGYLTGNTGVYEGNCMPSPGVEPCKPRLTALKIYVTTPSDEYVETILIMSFVSDEKGRFRVDLPVGDYSLFIYNDGQYVCSHLECDPSCYCYPVKIVSEKTTAIEVNLDLASW